MRRLPLVAVLLALAPLAFAAPAQAQEPPLPITIEDDAIAAIGPFGVASDPRVGAAIRAFGRATRRTPRGVACTARWQAVGLKVVFVNLGGLPRGITACNPRWGKAQSFVASGPRFVTEAGLAVGQPSARIRELYPDARFERGAWTLVSVESPFGEGDLALLRAFTKGGAVTSLAGWVGAAGE